MLSKFVNNSGEDIIANKAFGRNWLSFFLRFSVSIFEI